MKRVSVSDILKNTYTCLPFEGLVKSVIGTPAPNAQMMIYGSPGSQKSTFIIALCAYLQNFGKVCYKALEEGESLTFQEKLKRVGDVFDPKKVILEDEILGQKGEFTHYSFVVIDSATVIGIDATHIAAMKKAYPNTMFIYVYQCTKDGKFRGSNEIEHEVDIALKAEKGTIKQQKNRCGGVEDCTVQEMIDFAQAKSKPISGFLGNVGKIEDSGDVPGLSRSEKYWQNHPPQMWFNFDDKKVRRGGMEINPRYKKLFGESGAKDTDFPEAVRLLSKDFGIKTFEYGNWTTEEDRRNYVKAASVVLTDLRAVTGIEVPGQGELSLCFGSRGVNKSHGHFDPNNMLINLTRHTQEKFKELPENERKTKYFAALQSRGMTSFVHEYGHFLDFLAGCWSDTPNFASGGEATFGGNNPKKGEYAQMINEIIKTLCGTSRKPTAFGTRLRDADNKKGSIYYTKRAEIFARTFEQWAALTLKKRNDYNAFFVKFKHEQDEIEGNVYPTAKEMELVMPLVDTLIAKIAAKLNGGKEPDEPKNKAKKENIEADLEMLITVDENGKIEKVEKINEKKEAAKTETASTENNEATTLPLTKIHTDVKRFQNRDKDYSHETVDKIVANYDPNRLDPIVVWKDASGKIFVLSGHSRFKAHQVLKKKTIPIRFFKGTEKEAIEYAKVHANRTATAEGLKGDIRAFKLQRDELKYSQAQLKHAWIGRYAKYEAYSYLNPNGKFLLSLETNDKTDYPNLMTKAQWAGILRKQYPQIANIHEDNMFDFLYLNDKSKGFDLDKESFMKMIAAEVTDKKFDSSKKLGFGKMRKDLRADTQKSEADKKRLETELVELRKRKKTANTNEEKAAINKLIENAEKDLALITKNIEKVENTQMALFGAGEAVGNKKKRELSPKQVELHARATKIQVEGGTETKKITVFKIKRGDAIHRAAKELKFYENLSGIGKKPKRELSPRQQELHARATKIQVEGGTETKKITVFKIKRGDAIHRAAKELKFYENLSGHP